MYNINMCMLNSYITQTRGLQLHELVSVQHLVFSILITCMS
jgi:hypothetical protein